MNNLKHRALNLSPAKKVVFTATSKKYFYMRFFVTKFVIENDAVPLNPFTSFDYFMLDSVDRDLVRRANNTLVERADELWVFGDISDGVQAEIIQASEKSKPVRYFAFRDDKNIVETTEDSVVYE